MSDPPPSPVASPDRGRARRAWMRGAIIAFVLLSALIGGTVFLSRYEPLSPAGLALADPTFAEPWAYISVPDPGIPVYRATYREGRILRYGFLLRNGGPFGVTVTSLQQPAFSGDAFMLEAAGAALGDGAAPASLDPSRIAPFQPFSLGPGDDRWVVLEWRFLHCGHGDEGTSMTFSRTELSYRVLGFTHLVSLELPIPVQVPAPPRSSCPGA